jgi:hypothetical protein
MFIVFDRHQRTLTGVCVVRLIHDIRDVSDLGSCMKASNVARLSHDHCRCVNDASMGDAVSGDANSATSKAQCPICAFIEAGPCGDEHKVEVSCCVRCVANLAP